MLWLSFVFIENFIKPCVKKAYLKNVCVFTQLQMKNTQRILDVTVEAQKKALDEICSFPVFAQSIFQKKIEVDTKFDGFW